MTTRMDDRERAAVHQEQEIDQRSVGDNLRLGVGIALIAALVLFFVQNFDDAKIKFLWMDWKMPLVFALLLSAAVGSLATWLFTTLRARAARQR